MKDIFKNIEGREWDWFEENEPFEWNVYGGDKHGYTLSFNTGVSYSLADLLANKSWCKAVWKGKGFYNSKQEFIEDGYIEHSLQAFQLLQESEEKAIDYILTTMI